MTAQTRANPAASSTSSSSAGWKRSGSFWRSRLSARGSSETRSDAVRVHLPYIHQLVQDEGFSHQYACWHRLQPMAAQSCYAAFAPLGRDAAAKWLSWLALLALVVLIVDEVRRAVRLAANGALRRRGGR